MSEPPPFAYDWRALATEAAAAVIRRERDFAKIVAAKGEPSAERELSAWRAIAAQWQAAISYQPLPGDAVASAEDMRAALEESLGRCNRALRKEYDALSYDVCRALRTVDLWTIAERHGQTVAAFLDAHYQRDRVAALLWWQLRTGVESIGFLIGTTIEARARSHPLNPARMAA